MKISKTDVKQFEKEQEQFGTETALGNFVIHLGYQLMKSVGVKRISVVYEKPEKASNGTAHIGNL